MCCLFKNLFGLRIIFEQQELTCCDFQGSYLMIETGGHAKPEGKTPRENSAKLRFNVADIDKALHKIQSCGIQASISRHSWGSTINIYDPDGNRIGLPDEGTFMAPNEPEQNKKSSNKP